MYPSHKLATQTQRTTIRRLVKTRLLWTTIQASALLLYLIPHRPRTDDGGGRLLNWQRVPNDSAGTSVGFVRTAIEGNEPCPQEDLDSACRTEGQCCYQRPQVGTRWVGVGGVEEVVQGHQLPVASVHRQVPQERLPRGRAAARRPGVALRRDRRQSRKLSQRSPPASGSAVKPTLKQADQRWCRNQPNLPNP
jgi:hypothetical protein